MSRLLCVDLSSIVHQIWHVSTQQPDPDHTSIASVARTRALSRGYDYVAVCCDSKRSFRKDIASTYKANRPPTEAPLKHQLLLAKEKLVEDGFACFEAEGFEADDVIATIVRLSTTIKPVPEVVIASMDKDLHQLIDTRVKQLWLYDNTMMGAAEVLAKFGVEPHQMRDWLVLVGDDSDNVGGVKSIGPKGATKILQRFGSLYALMKDLGKGAPALGLTPGVHKVLAESVMTMEIDRQLVSLSAEVPIAFEKIFEPRDQKTTADFMKALSLDEDNPMDPFNPITGEVATSPDAPPDAAPESPPAQTAAPAPTPTPPLSVVPPEAQKPEPKPAMQSAPPKPAEGPTVTGGEPVKGEPVKTDVLKMEATPLGSDVRPAATSLVAVDWKVELEPRSLREAMSLAAHLHASKLFSAYGTPQGVLSTILAGRELSIGAMASLRGFHIIDGKPSMSAGLMSALVLRSGLARQFSCIKRTKTEAVVRCWRKGEPDFLDVAYTLEDAKIAKLLKADSGWEKNPADMCVSRATAIGGRLKWQDVLFGLYTPEELGHEELEEAA